ncbi:hypothetical protein J6590_062614 [Homalodisca vitripennis]|nr:hypothetical protein J6590_062614 [Homalodisca vitripennis]
MAGFIGVIGQFDSARKHGLYMWKYLKFSLMPMKSKRKENIESDCFRFDPETVTFLEEEH